MISVDMKELISELSEIENNSSHAAGLYASVLRIALMPSTYNIDDTIAAKIIASLRKNETNSSAVRVIRLLNEILPPNE